MNICVVALGVVLGCGRPAAPVQAEQPARVDAWFAEDKLRHFGLSFAVTTFGYAAARTTLDPSSALLAAAAGGALLGIGKELADARAGRWFSTRDLAWDAAGVALGITFADRIR